MNKILFAKQTNQAGAMAVRLARNIMILAIILQHIGSSAHAAVSVIAQYSLGDHDSNAPGATYVISTTKDIAGTNDLTAYGSPLYSDSVGTDATLASGTRLCATFNGNGQYLGCPIFTTVTDNFGIEAWVRPNALTGTRMIIYNGNTSTSGWGLIQNGNVFALLIGGVAVRGTAPVVTNTWTHLALVREGGTLSLFVNGLASIWVLPAPTPPTSGGFAIAGRGQGGTAETFDGAIDDVRLFTFTNAFDLNDLSIHQRRPNVQSASVANVTPTTAVLQGIVAPNEWPTTAWFEWGTGLAYQNSTLATPISPNNGPLPIARQILQLTAGAPYHFRLVASNAFGTTYGADRSFSTSSASGFGGALSFSGATQYMTVSAATHFQSNFTIEAWVYIRSYNSWSRLLDFGNGLAKDNIVFALSSANTGRPNLSIFSGDQSSSLDSSASLPLNVWTHLAATFSGRTGRIFINGSQVAQNTNMVPPRAVLRTNNFVGRSNWNDAYANAIFDEIHIWSVARSVDQIADDALHQLTDNEPGLLLDFRCDIVPGSSTVDDYALNDGATPGTLVNNATPTNSIQFPILPRFSATRALWQSANSIDLQAGVLPGGAATRIWFNWGASTNYDHTTSPQTVDGVVTTTVTDRITAIAADQIYHWRVVASNAAGITMGPDLSTASSLVVKNGDDNGPGSLREALATTCDGGSVKFGPGVHLIQLTSGELAIDRPLFVFGPGAPGLTITASNMSRIFNVTGGRTFLSGMTIADGFALRKISDFDGSGGGIRVSGADLSIESCVFKHNYADINGGGVAVFGAGLPVQVRVTASTFVDNHVGGIGNGAGICSGYLPSTVIDSSILVIDLCTFTGNNMAGQGANSVWGGAIATTSIQCDINQCTVSGNSADRGGGIFFYTGTTTIRNTICAGNSANTDGPDAGLRASAGTVSVTSLGHNLIGDTAGVRNIFVPATNGDVSGISSTPLLPNLAPLADYGGPTPTMALLAGSPAIDAGDDTEIETDQRNLPRRSGDHVDIGAFELQAQAATPALLGNVTRFAGGVQFEFANASGVPFYAVATTNLALPLAQWTVLGPASEITPGRYRYIDFQTTNTPQRFYSVVPILNP